MKKNTRKLINNIRYPFYFLFAIIFWGLIWQFSAKKIDIPFLFPTPKEVYQAFISLLKTDSFYLSVSYTFTSIVAGFFYGVFFGVILTLISFFSKFLRVFISIPLRIIKAVPVASFIILALLWIDSSKLATLISFLMVLPVIYLNLLNGIDSTDSKLIEMATVFKLSFIKKLRYIYLPHLMPHFISACSIGLGFCWKSGIAAEIIGLTKNSIGNNLYQSKIYLDTDEVFAWTVVIVLISLVFEKIILIVFNFVHSILTKSYTQTKTMTLTSDINDNSYETCLFKKELSIKNVSKTFDGKDVLLNFSLKAKASENISIIGPSGSGKTTLINILINILKPDHFDSSNHKDHIYSIVFQEDRLCPNLNAVDNISLIIPSSYKNVVDKSKIISLLNILELGDSLYKPVSKLSGGMRQRVSIARALLYPSSILILDEAFKGLDEQLKKKVMYIVKNNAKERILLSITHIREETSVFDSNIINIPKLSNIENS